MGALVVVAAGCAATAPAPGPVASAATAAASGPCGGFERRAPAARKVSLLGGRLSMLPLEGLEPLARPTDIMSAPASEEMETRLFLADGEKKLVVFTEELFARPVPDLVAAVRASDERLGGASFEALTLPGGGRAVLAVHPTLEAPNETIPVAHLFTTLPDQTVQVVHVFVSPEVVTEGSAGCTAVARRLLATVEPGTRRLALAAGQRIIDDAYLIDVPDQVAVVPEPGPDFAVYRLKLLRGLGVPPAELGLYFGHAPSFHPAGDAKKLNGTLLGKAVTWHESSEEGFIRREAMVKTKADAVHVFLGAASPDDVELLFRMAATLRPKPSP